MTDDGPSVLQLCGPSTGGIRRVVAALSTTLADRGWSVLTAGPPGVLEGLVRQDAVVRLGGSSVITARRRIAALARRVDVVHA
ncbi:MAG: hypothetical protein JF603_15835, partial [Acidobacteria bacterium]|nr:hypothetical protein [Acidobacteriota bacterium]